MARIFAVVSIPMRTRMTSVVGYVAIMDVLTGDVRQVMDRSKIITDPVTGESRYDHEAIYRDAKYISHGGSRANAGRKPKYGTIKTKRIYRVIPVDWIEDLDKWLAERAAHGNTSTTHL